MINPMNKNTLFKICFIVALLLLVPFLASLVTDEVKWELTDYLVAGSILFCAGVFVDVIHQKINKPPWRVFFIIVLVVVIILIWVELAVGIFNSPVAGN